MISPYILKVLVCSNRRFVATYPAVLLLSNLVFDLLPAQWNPYWTFLVPFIARSVEIIVLQGISTYIKFSAWFHLMCSSFVSNKRWELWYSFTDTPQTYQLKDSHSKNTWYCLMQPPLAVHLLALSSRCCSSTFLRVFVLTTMQITSWPLDHRYVDPQNSCFPLLEDEFT